MFTLMVRDLIEASAVDGQKECSDSISIKDRVNHSRYVKPKISKINKMRFPIDILEATGKGSVCRQCSSCHNCR